MSLRTPPNDDTIITEATGHEQSQWQALSAWSIASFLASSLKNIVTNGYAIIPIFYATWSQGASFLWIIYGLIILTLLLTCFAFIQWKKYRYRITKTQLDVKRGLIFTKKDEIPLRRIQNIRYEQPFYFRPLKLAVLVVETAGSKKDEATLSALDMTHAKQLKHQLLQLAKTPNDTHEHQAQDTSLSDANNQHVQEQSSNITTRSLKELVLFGFYQNNLIWFAVIAGPIAGQIEWEEVAKSPLIKEFINWLSQYTHNSIGFQIALFIGALLGFYILLSLISIISSVLKYHPYSLDKFAKTLQRSGGVISHQQDSLAIKRIQVLHFQQPLLARIFNRWTVHLKQVKGQEIEERTQQHVIIPSVKTSEIQTIFNKIFPNLPALKLPTSYQGISISWFYRRAALPFIPSVFLLIGHLINGNQLELPLLAFGVGLAALGLIYIRYRRWGYVMGDNCVWIHTGLFSRHWKRVEYDKVQHIRITQTASQRKQQLAYIDLGLASGTLTLPYIPYKIAKQISDQSLTKVSTNPKPWF